MQKRLTFFSKLCPIKIWTGLRNVCFTYSVLRRLLPSSSPPVLRFLFFFIFLVLFLLLLLLMLFSKQRWKQPLSPFHPESTAPFTSPHWQYSLFHQSTLTVQPLPLFHPDSTAPFTSPPWEYSLFHQSTLTVQPLSPFHSDSTAPSTIPPWQYSPFHQSSLTVQSLSPVYPDSTVSFTSPPWQYSPFHHSTLTVQPLPPFHPDSTAPFTSPPWQYSLFAKLSALFLLKSLPFRFPALQLSVYSTSLYSTVIAHYCVVSITAVSHKYSQSARTHILSASVIPACSLINIICWTPNFYRYFSLWSVSKPNVG